MEFSYQKKVELSFADALAKTKQALSEAGFGIISEINVKQTFEKKLAIKYGEYVILGACRPQSAHAVLEADKQLGLLLPCNVIVYVHQNEVFVATVLPSKILAVTENKNLAAIASEVETKLKMVVDSI